MGNFGYIFGYTIIFSFLIGGLVGYGGAQLIRRAIPAELEVNTIFMNKSLNNGYIYFKDYNLFERCTDALKKNHVQWVSFIYKINDTKYYGVRMFRMKKQFLDVMVDMSIILKEVKE